MSTETVFGAPDPASDISERNLRRHHPERSISGFSHKDSTFIFYSLLGSVIGASSVVLDLGAGRGAQGEYGHAFKRSLVNFKGRALKVVGIDVDEAVQENPMLDEAHVAPPGEPLPFPDCSFDIVFSDWVLEHVDDPVAFAGEVRRILKPGGWFCARTPNKRGLIAAGGRLVPNRLHTRVLRQLQPNRLERDVFPTRYRLNTRRDIATYFPATRWNNFSFLLDSEMMYLARYRVLFAASELITKLLPRYFRPVLLVFVQRKPD